MDRSDEEIARNHGLLPPPDRDDPYWRQDLLDSLAAARADERERCIRAAECELRTNLTRYANNYNEGIHDAVKAIRALTSPPESPDRT